MRFTVTTILSALALVTALPALRANDTEIEPTEPGKDFLGQPQVVSTAGCNYGCKEGEPCKGGCEDGRVCYFLTYRIMPDYALKCMDKDECILQSAQDNADETSQPTYCAEEPKDGRFALNYGHF